MASLALGITLIQRGAEARCGSPTGDWVPIF